MDKEKAPFDYLTRTLLIQFSACSVLFIFLFAVSKANTRLFSNIAEIFSPAIEENVSYEEAKEAFHGVGELIKDNVDADKNAAPKVELDEKSEDTNETVAEADKPYVSIRGYSLKSQMILPVAVNVTSDFGYREHPISGDYSFHSGTDLAAAEGTDIHAAFFGVVTVAESHPFNGNYIKIQHSNGIMTVYCHCKELFVSPGDVVNAGDVIASVGSTGDSTGPHLHFEFRIDGVSYDPMPALSAAGSADEI